MEKLVAWWKTVQEPSMEKRYVTLVKAILLGVLPLLCCLVHCAAQGRGLGEVYLPASEWNDELFYFKQVEGIVHYGYPQGYFGFNESHAMKLSFAAWSPVLVFPWIIWGLLFGWNLMSPIICNILLMTLACFLFVWLVKPTWKQLGVLALLFCLYTPFVRYMLSVMPEVICFSLLILFYGLAINYLQREKGYKLALLFLLSGVMTLMRPYMLLFLLLAVFFWIRRAGWKGAAGAAVVLTVLLGLYAAIKHYLGAEYFTPLFFTDWFEAFFEQRLWGGVKFMFRKLCSMGETFIIHTKQGIKVGLASGAIFAGYLVCMCVLLFQSLKDGLLLRRLRQWRASAQMAEPMERKSGGVENAAKGGFEESGDIEKEPADSSDKSAIVQEKTSRNVNSDSGYIKTVSDRLIIQAHLAFSFVAMLFALLLMYKITEGSKHLLTFMAAALFVIALMETRYFKKVVFVGITFAYLYAYMAVDPYDYQVPFAEGERQEALVEWAEAFEETLVLDREEVPSYENVVVWVFNDSIDGSPANTPWQLLYALPEGFGISCCMKDYLLENFDSLESRYLATTSEGEIDRMCREAGCRQLYRGAGMVLYEMKLHRP